MTIFLGCVSAAVWAPMELRAQDKTAGGTPNSLPAGGNGTAPAYAFDNASGDAPGFVGGAGMHILRPVISSNPGLQSTIFNGGNTFKDSRDFDWNFSASPSIWLGYTSESGLGARLNWFYFAQSSQQQSAVAEPVVFGVSGTGVSVGSGSGNLSSFGLAPGQTDSISAGYNLIVSTVDADVTQSLRLGNWSLIAGAGIRWLHVNQGMQAAGVLGGLPAGQFSTTTENDHINFDGIGPSLLVEAHRGLGNSALGLYACGRGGVVFGDRHDTSVVVSTDNFPAGTQTVDEIHNSNFQTVEFAELEVGVEWAPQCRGVSPYVSVGFEGMGYFGVGNAQFLRAEGSEGSQNVGLFGVAIRAGLRY